MKCEECRDLLWIYMEWETTPEESAEIKAHLTVCPECRKAASQHMAIMETLRSLPEAELPEGYHTELMQKIAAAAPSMEKAEETAILPNHVSTPPAEWKVVRKTEILQKAKAEKEREKKQRHSWKGLSLVAAAVLVVAAAGGINGVMHMRQTPPEPVQLSANPADEGSAENAPVDSATKDVAAPVSAAGGAEEASQKQMADIISPAPEYAMHTAPQEPAQPEPESQPQPPLLRSAPVPDSAPAAPENAVQSAPMAPALAEATEEMERENLDVSDDGMRFMAEPKPGDLLKLRPQNGADVYSSVRQTAEDYAGFEESTDGSSISVMIPVENLDAFFAELGTLGEIEWQTKGQEEAGATYRRVEILLETE